jgi:hypothetical protein
MKLVKLAAAAFALTTALAAHAQLGVYGMYSATQYTGIPCLSIPGPCSSAGNKVSPSGASGGLFYDFKTFGPIRLGIDARGGVAHANKSAASSGGGDNITHSSYVLAGLRGTVKTPISAIKPYLQISAGWNRSNVTELNPALYDNYLQYEAFGGVDVHIFPLLDLRPIELGIGNMNRFGTGTSATTSVGVRSIGAGVIFHLPTP